MIEGKSYDVTVCKNGSAGFCAAGQVARAGMRTAVVEKYGISGSCNLNPRGLDYSYNFYI